MPKKNNWRTVTVEQIGQVVTGHTPLKKIKEYYGEDYVWIKPTDIEIGKRFVPYTEEKYSQKAYEKYKSSLLPPLSTCVVTIGTVGEKICLTKEPSFTNQSINAIIPNQQEYDPKFVFYLMKYNLHLVSKRNPGTASGRHHVSKSNFSGIKVKAPDLPIQKIIGALLSRCDDLIENNIQRIEILEKMAELIFVEWFERFHFSEKEKPQLVESELGKIPEDWSISTIGEICEITMGQSPPGDTYNENGEGVPFYQGVRDFGKHFPSRRVFCSKPKRFAKSNDALFSVRAPVGDLNIANEDCCIGRGLASLRSKENHGSYLYYLLKSTVREWKKKFESKGTVFGSVTKDDVNNFKIIKPHSALIKKFNTIIDPIYKTIWNNTDQIITNSKISDLFLSNLMSQKIDAATLKINFEEL